MKYTALAVLLFSFTVAAQDTKPTDTGISTPAATTSPVAATPPATPPAAAPAKPAGPETKTPDAGWISEFDQANVLQTTIAKEKKDAGIDKLESLLEELSQDLIKKVPAGFHYNAAEQKFVADPKPTPTPEKK